MYLVGVSKLGSVLQVSHDNMSHVTCHMSHVVIENRVSSLDSRFSILDSCRDRESSVNLLLNGTVRGSHMSLGLQCLLCEEHISVD